MRSRVRGARNASRNESRECDCDRRSLADIDSHGLPSKRSRASLARLKRSKNALRVRASRFVGAASTSPSSPSPFDWRRARSNYRAFLSCASRANRSARTSATGRELRRQRRRSTESVDVRVRRTNASAFRRVASALFGAPINRTHDGDVNFGRPLRRNAQLGREPSAAFADRPFRCAREKASHCVALRRTRSRFRRDKRKSLSERRARGARERRQTDENARPAFAGSPLATTSVRRTRTQT